MTRAASVQFAEPMLFRVIRVHDWPTYDGWVWLDGYELNAAGDAIERRSIFVQVSGLRQLGTAPDVRARNSRRPGAATGTNLTRRPAPLTAVRDNAVRDNGAHVRPIR